MSDAGRAEATTRGARQRQAAAPSAWTDEFSDRALTGARVLLVEDDSASRDALAFVLAAYGARVASVASAADARGRLAEWSPTVIISDIGLPGEDGCALLRWLRAQEALQGGYLPAIAVSGFPAAETAARARAAGFDHFLSKPVDPLVLLRLLRAAMGDVGD